MSIDKGNIEAYLLDYLEGRLDPVLTAELMAFLSENPAYEKWIPEFDGLTMQSGPVLENKDSLRKDFKDIGMIGEQNFEEFCIAWSEGLLGEPERSKLSEFLAAHPESKKTFDLYQQLKLAPDLSIVFESREKLKKPAARKVLLRYFYGAAAMAAAIMLIFLLRDKPGEVAQVLSQSTKVNPPEQVNSIVPDENLPVKPIYAKPVAALPVNSSGIMPADSFPPLAARRSDVAIATIEPIPARIPLPIRTNITVIRKDQPAPVNPVPRQTIDPPTGGLLASILKKINLWKAAETAVSGFNYLTESKISLSHSVDDHGKITEFGLGTEEPALPTEKTK